MTKNLLRKRLQLFACEMIFLISSETLLWLTDMIKDDTDVIDSRSLIITLSINFVVIIFVDCNRNYILRICKTIRYKKICFLPVFFFVRKIHIIQHVLLIGHGHNGYILWKLNFVNFFFLLTQKIWYPSANFSTWNNLWPCFCMLFAAAVSRFNGHDMVFLHVTIKRYKRTTRLGTVINTLQFIVSFITCHNRLGIIGKRKKLPW